MKLADSYPQMTEVRSFGSVDAALKSLPPKRPKEEEMQHGEWLSYLDEIDISRETARRFMRLADSYQIPQLGEFGSVDAALKSLPPATASRNRPSRKKSQ